MFIYQLFLVIFFYILKLHFSQILAEYYNRILPVYKLYKSYDYIDFVYEGRAVWSYWSYNEVDGSNPSFVNQVN